jgi:hypothetical protein
MNEKVLTKKFLTFAKILKKFSTYKIVNVRSGKFEAFLNFSQCRNKNVATYLMPGMLSPRRASFRLAVRYGSKMMASRRDLDVFRKFLGRKRNDAERYASNER